LEGVTTREGTWTETSWERNIPRGGKKAVKYSDPYGRETSRRNAV